MKLSILLCGFLGAFLVTMATGAVARAEVSVAAVGKVNSCGYYSSTDGQFDISYVNRDLQWGTRVFLIHGLSGVIRFGGGQQSDVEWQMREVTELSALGPYTWGASLEKQLNSRSSATFYDRLSFVIEIRMPDGSTQIDRGGNSLWGFYEAKVPYPYSCRTEATVPVKVEVIDR